MVWLDNEAFCSIVWGFILYYYFDFHFSALSEAHASYVTVSLPVLPDLLIPFLLPDLYLSQFPLSYSQFYFYSTLELLLGKYHPVTLPVFTIFRPATAHYPSGFPPTTTFPTYRPIPPIPPTFSDVFRFHLQVKFLSFDCVEHDFTIAPPPTRHAFLRLHAYPTLITMVVHLNDPW